MINIKNIILSQRTLGKRELISTIIQTEIMVMILKLLPSKELIMENSGTMDIDEINII